MSGGAPLPGCQCVAGLSAVVLCGGRSLRFGGEKGLALFRGVPLVARALARLDQISADVWISTNQPDLYRHLGRPMVADRQEGCGPLGGVQAALAAARNPLLAVLSCDMPFASAALLRYLYLCQGAGPWDAIVPARSPAPGAGAAGPPQCEPLHAVYSRACLPAIEAALRQGERRVISFFPRVRLRWVAESEWLPVAEAGDQVFANINTAEELSRLEHLPWA